MSCSKKKIYKKKSTNEVASKNVLEEPLKMVLYLCRALGAVR